MIRNIIFTLLAITLVMGCSSKKKDMQKQETAEAIPVKVMKLEKKNIAKTLDYTATFQSDEQGVLERDMWKSGTVLERDSYWLKWIRQIYVRQKCS